MTAVLMLLAQTQTAAREQCQPNCLGSIQIFLNEDCSVEILSEKVLSSPPCPNSNLQVQMRINGIWVPAIVNSSHINPTILVLVLDLNSGSSCFLNMFVRDNKLTELICPSDLPALSVNASCQAALSDYTTLAILSGSCDDSQNSIV